MIYLWKASNSFHFNKDLCARGDEINIQRLESEESQAGAVTGLQVYDLPLANVTVFK